MAKNPLATGLCKSVRTSRNLSEYCHGPMFTSKTLCEEKKKKTELICCTGIVELWLIV